ncbi:uncharacterized protein LOC127720440 isoform X2 [Mytilus californianus]|uniref:uncharacterized protein LOC127720440 isoform X2 n=1 Tax=Mytilus californianus TaxID=6549 RepID=UPI002246B918|nr:uncharacterized protein LOC127720440 isoform X2 [Mytilus californianus]
MMWERIKDIICVYICVFIFINQCSCNSIALKQQDCQKDQVERLYRGRHICCYPIKCKPGQKFDFCRTNNGHDTCQNCPNGYSHNDLIDTAKWFFRIDPCVPVEDCSDYSDLIQENGECVCDRTRGYYGRDKHKCAADPKCKKAGFELSQDGHCLMCGEEHFKINYDYSLCINKTRCTNDQEVDFKGSHMVDRTCRRRIDPKPDISAPVKPIIKETNKTKYYMKVGDGDRSKGTEKKNETVEVPDLDRPIKEVSKHSSDGNLKLIVALVISLPGIIVSYIIYRRSKRGQQWNDLPCNLNCCPQNSVNHNNVYNKKYINVEAKNVVVGDCGKIVADDSEVSENTPMKEIDID